MNIDRTKNTSNTGDDCTSIKKKHMNRCMVCKLKTMANESDVSILNVTDANIGFLRMGLRSKY